MAETKYTRRRDNTGPDPTNTSTVLKIPDPVPEEPLLIAENLVSLDKLLQCAVNDVVNTSTVTQLSFIFAFQCPRCHRLIVIRCG